MPEHESFYFAVCVREKCFVDKIYGSRCAFNVQQKDFDLRIFCAAGHNSLCRKLRRNVSRTQTNRLVASIDTAICIVRRPASRVLKQSDGANSPIAAKIKPVQSSSWHANQITGFHFDRDDRPTCRMDVEQSASRNNVADFILVVPVLDVELRKHSVSPGVSGFTSITSAVT